MEITRQSIKKYFLNLINLKDHINTEAATKSIKKNVHFRGPNVYILIFAIIIASVGLNVNSIPVIIGAMLISPLMGPIIGFGLGVGTRDIELVWSALRNIAVMAGVSIVASTLYFLLTPLALTHPTELLARTNPSVYDVFIALFGGFAGILETSRKEKGTVMSGVAIATALMPPLCTVGYGIANLNWHYAIGALYLFFLNGILIASATYITVKALNYKTVNAADFPTRKRVWSIVMAILVLLVPSIYSAFLTIKQNNFKIQTNHFIEEYTNYNDKLYISEHTVNFKTKPYSVEIKLLGEKPDESDLENFYAAAEKAGYTRDQFIINDKGTADFRSLLNEEDKRIELLYKQQQMLDDYRIENNELKRQIDSLQSALDEAYRRIEELSDSNTKNESVHKK